VRTDKEQACSLGVPKWFRRYNKRYGSNLDSMAAQDKQVTATKLAQQKERERLDKLFGVQPT